MDKTFLEKTIEEEAEREFWDEYRKFLEKLNSDPFFKRLVISSGGSKIKLFNHGTNDGLLTGAGDRNTFWQEKTGITVNFKEAKEKVIQRKIEEKTRELLLKVSELEYLFGDRS